MQYPSLLGPAEHWVTWLMHHFQCPDMEQQHVATEGQRLLAQEKLLECHVTQCDCWLMQVFSVCLVVFTIVHVMSIQAKGTERYSMFPVYNMSAHLLHEGHHTLSCLQVCTSALLNACCFLGLTSSLP